MRKQTKLVAVLSAASLLAIGASMTAFAETPHWDQEDGEWVYLDRNGDKVAGEWKKSNGQWYYLDDDGYMAKDMLVEYNDNRYYVDANGVKVTNAWVAMDNDDYLDDEDVSTVWFYFDGNGKAVGYGKDEGAIKKINYGDGSTYQVVDGLGYDFYTEKSQTASSLISGEAKVLVNGNGKIKKSGTVTDIDGLKVTVKDYVVTKIVDENKVVVYEAE